jgi:hypothetical protein
LFVSPLQGSTKSSGIRTQGLRPGLFHFTASRFLNELCAVFYWAGTGACPYIFIGQAQGPAPTFLSGRRGGLPLHFYRAGAGACPYIFIGQARGPAPACGRKFHHAFRRGASSTGRHECRKKYRVPSTEYLTHDTRHTTHLYCNPKRGKRKRSNGCPVTRLYGFPVNNKTEEPMN